MTISRMDRFEGWIKPNRGSHHLLTPDKQSLIVFLS